MRQSTIPGAMRLFAVAATLTVAVPTFAQPNTSVAVTQPPPATQPLSAQAEARIAAVRAEAADFNASPIGEGRETAAAGGAETSEAVAQPQPPAKRGSGLDFTRVASALSIVILLIVGTRVLVRKFFAGASAPATSRAVKVIGRTSLAPRQQVLLLQVGGRVVVVGESNGTLATLAQIEDADEVARLLGQLQDEQIQRAASFGGLFGRMQKRYEEGDEPHAPAAEPSGINGDGAALNGQRHQAAALEEEQQMTQAKSDLSGLVEKVRALRSQLGQ